MAKLDNGELAAVVRAGAEHIGVGGRLDLVRSRDGGKSWGRPQTIADVSPDSRNPAFGQLSDGAIILAFSVYESYREDGEWDAAITQSTTFTMRSVDRGKTWTEPVELDVSPLEWSSPYGKIIELPDGTALMAAYGGYLPVNAGHFSVTADHLPAEKQGEFSCLYHSTDRGKSWRQRSLILHGGSEAALVFAPGEGRLIAAVRANSDFAQAAQSPETLAQSIAAGFGPDHLVCTESLDMGHTWSDPRKVAGRRHVPADLLLLRSGTIWLTYGHRVPPYGVQGMYSNDCGKSWNCADELVIADSSFDNDCGYPSSVQLDGGTIVTVCYVHLPATGRLPSRFEARAYLCHEAGLLTNGNTTELGAK